MDINSNMDTLDTVVRTLVMGASIYQAATMKDIFSKTQSFLTAGLTAGGEMLQDIASPLGMFTGIYSAGIAADKDKPVNVVMGMVIAIGSSYLFNL